MRTITKTKRGCIADRLQRFAMVMPRELFWADSFHLVLRLVETTQPRSAISNRFLDFLLFAAFASVARLSQFSP